MEGPQVENKKHRGTGVASIYSTLMEIPWDDIFGMSRPGPVGMVRDGNGNNATMEK
jgi:hypothetical protein